ncbi:MAG TPA: class I SAM-dependent methyltransferase [bacterium]
MSDARRERVLARVGTLFDELAARPGVDEIIPSFTRLHRELQEARRSGDADRIEIALARVYCVAHGSGGAYSPADRSAFEALGGYWCHAGGLEPLHLIAPFIGPETRLVDYGAGNGFQGLLIHHLWPHRLTTMVELGGPMIEQGRLLQALLGIPADRVAWVHANILDVPPDEFDVIYLYRPVRPEGPGRAFYEMLAGGLDALRRPVTVVSVADCLRQFLRVPVRIHHDDGQVVVYTTSPDGVHGGDPPPKAP